MAKKIVKMPHGQHLEQDTWHWQSRVPWSLQWSWMELSENWNLRPQRGHTMAWFAFGNPKIEATVVNNPYVRIVYFNYNNSGVSMDWSC